MDDFSDELWTMSDELWVDAAERLSGIGRLFEAIGRPAGYGLLAMDDFSDEWWTMSDELWVMSDEWSVAQRASTKP